MHFVYIIFSAKIDRYYVGESVDVINRQEQHNSSFYKTSSTTIADDWELKLALILDTRKSARIVEKYIKQMKSRKFIEKLIQDPIYLENFCRIVYEKFTIKVEKL